MFYLCASFHFIGKTIATLKVISDPQKDGYSRLTRDLYAHDIIILKIPPKVLLRSEHLMNEFNDEINNNTNADAIHVRVFLIPVEVLSIDPETQILEISSYVTLLWNELGLAWDPAEYNNITMIEFPVSDIWFPKLSVVNAVKDNNLIPPQFSYLSINFNGYIILSLAVNIKTSCQLDLTIFPFDEQQCDIIFHTNSMLRINLIPHLADSQSILRSFTAGGEWELKNLFNTLEVHQLSYYRTKVTVIQSRLILKRKISYYLFNVLGPMILFTLMNCLVFIIPPESGEKVSFLVSIFISNAVFTEFLSGVMPRSIDTKVRFFTYIFLCSMRIFYLCNKNVFFNVLLTFHYNA